jgi:hypothetical protein
MFGQVIWWGCLALEALLLFRGLRSKLFSRYPLFFVYISFICLQSLLRFSVYHLRPALYPWVYWYTEPLSFLAGCAVVFEIYRVGLAAYPGAARMARNLLALMFVIALTKGIVETWNDPHWRSISNMLQFEHALRSVQALAIVALFILLLFYSIPFGRNLRGVLLGYGLLVGETIIWLTFSSAGGLRLYQLWGYIHSFAYFLVLAIWTAHLWSYVPNPEPKKAVRLEEQYQTLAAATTKRLQQGRGYLAKVVGS